MTPKMEQKLMSSSETNLQTTGRKTKSLLQSELGLLQEESLVFSSAEYHDGA